MDSTLRVVLHSGFIIPVYRFWSFRRHLTAPHISTVLVGSSQIFAVGCSFLLLVLMHLGPKAPRT
jgi:hypothetical protein